MFVPGLALCRFRQDDGATRLGLVRKEQVYDLTAGGYGDLDAWLASTVGRIEQARQTLVALSECLETLCSTEALLEGTAGLELLAPIEAQEVWACGVTYEMSREARMRESEEPTIYGRVYDAPRPEIFFKTTPQRVVGPGEAVGIRSDSTWDVPEAELTLLVNPAFELVGYTIGNDMSSRDIEGQNPLYLPQAKIYDRCCALGPWVRLDPFDALDQAVRCDIQRDGETVFTGETHTSTIHRPFEELISYLGRCNSLPRGAFVLTGTGIVPPDTFTLQEGDEVVITFEGLGTLRNPVIELAAQ